MHYHDFILLNYINKLSVESKVGLVLNGVILNAIDKDCVITMLKLAAGEMDENQFTDWMSAKI
jgi:prophage maintenance system killer protein